MTKCMRSRLRQLELGVRCATLTELDLGTPQKPDLLPADEALVVLEPSDLRLMGYG